MKDEKNNPLNNNFFNAKDVIEPTKNNNIINDYMGVYNKRKEVNIEATKKANAKKVNYKHNQKRASSLPERLTKENADLEKVEYTLLLELFNTNKSTSTDLEILNKALNTNDFGELNRNVLNSRTFISLTGMSTVIKYIMELLYNYDFIDISNSYLLGAKKKTRLIRFLEIINSEYEIDIDYKEYIENFKRTRADIQNTFCMPNQESIQFFMASQNYTKRFLELNDVEGESDYENNVRE